MNFPEGNQFWKLRSKHGREKLFTTPDLLWEAATEYFEATDKRKWVKTEFNGKNATECHIPNETPYTLSGLCLYLNASREWWNKFKNANHPDFLQVVSRIDEIIYTQKFEGAAVGAFNANIISRDLGLRDGSDVTTNGKELEVPIFNVIPHVPSNDGPK